MILLRSFLSGHIRIKRTLEYYDAGIGPRVPFGGGFGPTVSANFAVALGDFTTLSSTSTMPTGGSIGRAGNAMLYDSTGKLTYAPNNLVLQSNTFTSTWTTSNATVAITNATTDPFSGSAAYKLAESNTPVNVHEVKQISITTVSGVNYMLSVYVKAAERTQVQIQYFDGTTNKFPTFNIPTSAGGSVTKATDGGIGSSWSFSDAGNGWYRIAIYATAGNTSGQVYIYTALGGTNSFAGTIGSGLYLYGAQLEAVTYQTTPSTYVATTTSAYYGPRFDYDPVTLAAKGLLVEGTRTNLLTYSQDFRDTATAGSTRPWSNGGVVVSITGTSPDGSSNANLLTEDSSTGLHRIFQQQTVATGFYTISLYAKPNGRNWIFLYFDGGLAQAYINISTGAVGTTTGTSFRSASTQSVGNGWYRVSMTLNNTTSTGQNLIINLASADNTTSYAGNGTSGIYFYGVQLEAGGFATSYIPTVASSVARAAETFSLTGYANRLVEAFYIDEETGANFSGNSALSTGTVTISPPTFGWVTSLRAYTNAYAGSISTPSWLSFSRAGNAMYYDSTGTLTWAPANLLTYSNTFTSWTASTYATVAATAVVNDPFGGTSAYKLYENATAADVHSISAASVSIGTSGRALFSVYVKAAERTQVCIQYNDASVNYYPVFNIPASSGGAVTVATSNGVGSNWSYQDAGNGWYRISIWTNSAAQPASCIIYTGNAGAFSYAGTVNSGIFIYGAQLERVTYQTAPSAYIPTTSAAVYGPRYDYDASTVPATPRGLLIEESRSNLLTYSNTFTGAGWTNNANVNVTSTTATNSPDGTQNAVIATATAGAGAATVTHSVTTVVASTTYNYSIYLKANVGSTINLNISDFVTGQLSTSITPSTGACSVTNSGPYSAVSISSENVGNGWWRYKITATQPSGQTGLAVRVQFPNNSDSVYLWGAQLEAGSFATSYVPTTTASVTRAADVAQLTGSALTTLQGSAGSAAVEVSGAITSGGSFAQILSVNTGTALIGQNGSSSTSIYTQNAAATVIPATLGSGTLSGTFRGVCSFDSVGMSIVGNNGTVGTGAGAPATVTTSTLGSRNGAYFINNCVRSMALYNQKLPDTILKQKSTVGAPY